MEALRRENDVPGEAVPGSPRYFGFRQAGAVSGKMYILFF
jgi:hypothetical protein